MTEPRYVIQRDNAHDQWAVIDRETLQVVAEFDKCYEAEHWICSEVIDLDAEQVER